MLRKILIADDNINKQEEMQQLLHAQGYEVLIVNSGDLAISKMHEFLPHMVMLDVIMPGKNGYEVCGYIKNEPELNQIPVILTFSEDEPFDISEARRVGATRCVPKTIDPDSLLATLDFIWAGVTSIEYPDNLAEAQAIVSSVEVNEEIPELEVELVDNEEAETGEENSSAYRFEVKLEESRENSSTLIAEESEPQKLAEQKTFVAIIGTPNHNAEFQNQLFFYPPPSEESFDDPLHVEEDLIYNNCRECGSRVIIGDVFCVECGAALEEAVELPSRFNCEQCGQSISQGDVFCLNCGAVQ